MHWELRLIDVLAVGSWTSGCIVNIFKGILKIIKFKQTNAIWGKNGITGWHKIRY